MTIGTQEANASLYANVRMARRAGPNIDAGGYCHDRDFFNSILSNIWEYQWFDKHFDLTDDIADTLYRMTHGMLFFLFEIYIKAQQKYVMTDKASRPKTIDAKYFERVANEYYKGTQVLVALSNNQDSQDRQVNQALSALADARVAGLAAAQMEREKAYANALTDPKLNEQRELRKRIYQNVANTAKTVRLNIDNTLIDVAVKAVVYNKDNYGKDEDALSQLAWDEAKKLASKPGRKAKKKVGEITLRELMPTTPEVESPSADEQKDN